MRRHDAPRKGGKPEDVPALVARLRGWFNRRRWRTNDRSPGRPLRQSVLEVQDPDSESALIPVSHELGVAKWPAAGLARKGTSAFSPVP